MPNETKLPLIYSSKHSLHAPPVEYWNGRLLTYPEMPQRAENIKKQLTSAGLVDVIEVEEPLAKDIIARVHDRAFVDYLEEFSTGMDEFLSDDDNFYDVEVEAEAHAYFNPAVFPIRKWMRRVRESRLGRHGYYCFDMEAPLGSGTWEAAIYSAKVAFEGAQMLLDGRAKVVYSLCRPPGHHVGPDFYGGYCYLNNAAIAAHHLATMGKVAIIDVDYHHGNGTQAIFWENPNVFFGSIHAHPDQEYPYVSGWEDEIGGGRAKGTNANYPLLRRSGEEEYLRALDSLLERLTTFKPEMVLVSLGFDTYEKDPVAFFNITHAGYRRMGEKFGSLDLPLLLVQEGGYNVRDLGELAEEVLRGILGA